MKDPAHTLRRTIQNPDKVPHFLIEKIREYKQVIKLTSIRKRKNIPRQKPYVETFTENKEYAIIILDACRYDVFKDMYSDYLEGELQEVWSTGRWTGDYARRMWNDYTDLDYISAAPVVSDFYFDHRDWDNRPQSKFRSVHPLWKTHWDIELGTVHPSDVTNRALQVATDSGDTRFVAHYLQPHFPYIGEYHLTVSDETMNIKDRYERGIGSRADEYLEAISSGEISDSELQRAYISNTECVFPEVCRLIDQLDCPVVVTADHGENLGENGYYLHNHDTSQTRRVPWLVVDEITFDLSNYQSTPEHQHDDREITDSEVQSRLEKLGYVM